MVDELLNLSFFIKETVEFNNKKGICVLLENTTASILNYYLSLRTNLPVYTTHYNINYTYPEPNSKWFPIPDDVSDLGNIYINTYLLEKSEQDNLLLISNRDFVEKHYVRNYHRSEIVDYFPLFKRSLDNYKTLRWSEIDKLYNQIDFNIFPKYKDCYQQLPRSNDKAYSTDITYAEYEWLMDIEKLYDNPGSCSFPPVKNDDDPTKHPKWFTFTIRQKQIIAQLHQIEKQTRYKAISNGI